MAKEHKLLIVDDESANLQKLKRTFMNEYDVYEASDGKQALQMFAEHEFSAVIADQKMPGMTGVDLLREVLNVNRETIRIVLTGYTEIEELMDAINEGHVHCYLTKPWEPDFLRQQVRQEIQRLELKRENRRLTHELKVANDGLQIENQNLKNEMEAFGESSKKLIYKSRPMKDLICMLDRVVSTDSTVLIQGETGTGKELLARYIHENSPRKDRAFVAVNCGAIPADLVESSFFGHRKGAFTGATGDQKGYFKLAEGGTLFLDEISEAPGDLQVKLLRVLQDGEVLPIGAQESEQANVRIVAATNRSLSQRVEEKQFRQDLFFRLNVFSVHVPPLRMRQGDVEVLCQNFLEKFEKRMNKKVSGFDSSVLDILKSYYWPGNVRELENEIERMLILCESEQPISVSMLSERLQAPQNSFTESSGLLKEQVAQLEQRLILESLKEHGGNKSRAAQALGITRQTIIAKLKQFENC